MYACCCAGVTSGQIEQYVKNGASFADIQRELGVACCCCCCVGTVNEIIERKLVDEN